MQIVSTVASRPADEPEGELTYATTKIEAALDIAQTGRDAQLTLRPTEVTMPELDGRTPEVDPVLFERADPAELTASLDVEDWLKSSEGVLVLGAALTDPAGDALPIEDDDPRLVDLDEDGRPGVTIRLGGFRIYAVVRVLVSFDGAATKEEVAGTATLTLDFEVLGDDIPFVTARARIEDAASETEVIESSATFRLIRVPAPDAPPSEEQ